MCALSVGVGRKKADENVDFSAGFEIYKKIGDKVDRGDVLALVFSSRDVNFESVAEDYVGTLGFLDEKTVPPKLIYKSF